MASYPAHVPLLATRRGALGGGTVECIHYGSIAVVDRAGRVVAGAGDSEGANFTRSTLKPLQALPFVDDGGMQRYGFGSQELALLCASHSGETMHTELVRSMLERVGARAADLQCGAHVPRYFSAAGMPCPSHFVINPLHHNCSGKHSGFLAYCRLHGHRLGDYLAPDAPLQVRIRNTVQDFAGGRDLIAGTDGCSAPNYALPLARLAQVYCRIACDDDPRLRAIHYAMTRHPDLVSGTRRTDLALMQAGGGDWVAKVGADGLQAMGIRSQGLGIAIRVAGGDTWALHVTTIEVLHQLGLLEQPGQTVLGSHFRPAQLNASGRETGRALPLFTLPRVLH